MPSPSIAGAAILPINGDIRMMTRQTATEVRLIPLGEAAFTHQVNASQSRIKSKIEEFGGGGTGI